MTRAGKAEEIRSTKLTKKKKYPTCQLSQA